MGITNSSKTVDKTSIQCNELVQVTLALAAAPTITSNPVDLVLVINDSASMAGEDFDRAKAVADQLIDIIDQASDTTLDGTISGGSQIGIVSFNTTATINNPLETNAVLLKQTVNSLTTAAEGTGNHYDAFSKAISLFDNAGTNETIIAMITDGDTEAGANADNIARYARDTLGIVVYSIGIGDNINVAQLNEWATDPDSSHVILMPTDEEIDDMFGALTQNITNAGATNINIVETVSEEFEIYEVVTPAAGTVTELSERSLQWSIPSLGVAETEGQALEFYVQHVGTTSGQFEVNESITYTDTEGNTVNFGSPVITVDCGETTEYTEPCPEAVTTAVTSCQDTIRIDMSDVELSGRGRLAEVSVTLNNVCPNRRVALAVFLSEVDGEGNEYPRGRKIFTIPAITGTECQNIQVNCIKFVLPEDLTIDGTDGTVCAERQFNVRAIANVVDYDYFGCCTPDPTNP